MSSVRFCPQCEEPFTGRADKRFCSTACRAQHFRDQQGPLADEVDPDLADEAAEDIALPGPPVGPPRIPDWAPADAGLSARQVDAVIAEALRQHQQQAAQQAARVARQALHARYERGVETWLGVEEQPLAARAVRQHLQEVDKLVADYRAHPAINQTQHPTQQRLQVLYQVGDALRALQGELAEQAAGFRLWGAATPTATLTWSKKQRRAMRDSLLGEV